MDFRSHLLTWRLSLFFCATLLISSACGQYEGRAPHSLEILLEPTPEPSHRGENRRVLNIGDGSELSNSVVAKENLGDDVTNYVDPWGASPSYADPSLLNAVMNQADQANFRYPTEPITNDPNEINPFGLFPPSFHELLEIPLHQYKNGSEYSPHKKTINNPFISSGYSSMKVQGVESKRNQKEKSPVVAYVPKKQKEEPTISPTSPRPEFVTQTEISIRKINPLIKQLEKMKKQNRIPQKVSENLKRKSTLSTEKETTITTPSYIIYDEPAVTRSPIISERNTSPQISQYQPPSKTKHRQQIPTSRPGIPGIQKFRYTKRKPISTTPTTTTLNPKHSNEYPIQTSTEFEYNYNPLYSHLEKGNAHISPLPVNLQNPAKKVKNVVIPKKTIDFTPSKQFYYPFQESSTKSSIPTSLPFHPFSPQNNDQHGQVLPPVVNTRPLPYPEIIQVPVSEQKQNQYYTQNQKPTPDYTVNAEVSSIPIQNSRNTLSNSINSEQEIKYHDIPNSQVVHRQQRPTAPVRQRIPPRIYHPYRTNPQANRYPKPNPGFKLPVDAGNLVPPNDLRERPNNGRAPILPQVRPNNDQKIRYNNHLPNRPPAKIYTPKPIKKQVPIRRTQNAPSFPSFFERFNIFNRNPINRRSGISDSSSDNLLRKDDDQSRLNKDEDATKYKLVRKPIPVQSKKVVVIGPFDRPPIGAPLIVPKNEKNKKVSSPMPISTNDKQLLSRPNVMRQSTPIKKSTDWRKRWHVHSKPTLPKSKDNKLPIARPSNTVINQANNHGANRRVQVSPTYNANQRLNPNPIRRLVDNVKQEDKDAIIAAKIQFPDPNSFSVQRSEQQPIIPLLIPVLQHNYEGISNKVRVSYPAASDRKIELDKNLNENNLLRVKLHKEPSLFMTPPPIDYDFINKPINLNFHNRENLPFKSNPGPIKDIKISKNITPKPTEMKKESNAKRKISYVYSETPEKNEFTHPPTRPSPIPTRTPGIPMRITEFNQYAQMRRLVTEAPKNTSFVEPKILKESYDGWVAIGPSIPNSINPIQGYVRENTPNISLKLEPDPEIITAKPVPEKSEIINGKPYRQTKDGSLVQYSTKFHVEGPDVAKNFQTKQSDSNDSI